MDTRQLRSFLALILLMLTTSLVPTLAAEYPTPQVGDWITRDFRFHTGEVMAELRRHYITIGNPSGQPVLILPGAHSARCSFCMVRSDRAAAC
jgi:homoserine O-acetyltransferase